MADVYLCSTPKDERVAIKWLRENHPIWEQRFQREADILASLNHPNIPTFFAIEKEDNHSFIVMEYIPGVTGDVFAEKVQKLPPSERHFKIAQIGKQLASALDYLHQQQIIHRDIKPSNIIITSDFDAFLLDFGTIKEDIDAVDVTAIGQFIGTPRYASPEQLDGEKLTTKSDQFSLGATLFFLLLHKRPFDSAQRNQMRSAAFFDPSIPDHLDNTLSTLLQIEPEKRFSSMFSVQAAFSTETYFSIPLAGRSHLLSQLSQTIARLQKGAQLVVRLNGCQGSGRNWASSILIRGAKRYNIEVLVIVDYFSFLQAQNIIQKRQALLIIIKNDTQWNFGIPIIEIEVPLLSLADVRRSLHSHAPKTKRLSIQAENLYNLTGGLPKLLIPLLQRYTKNAVFELSENIEIPEIEDFFTDLNWEDWEIIATLFLSEAPLSETVLETITQLAISEQLVNLTSKGLIRKNSLGWFCSNQLFGQRALKHVPDIELIEERLEEHRPSQPQIISYQSILLSSATGNLSLAKQNAFTLMEQSQEPLDKCRALLVLGQIHLDIGIHDQAKSFLSDATALATAKDFTIEHALSHAYRARIALEEHHSTPLGARHAIDRLLSIIKTPHPVIQSIWAWAVAALGDLRAWNKATDFYQKNYNSLSSIQDLRCQFYLVQGYCALGQEKEALTILAQLIEHSHQYPLLHWEFLRAKSVLTGETPPITGPLAYNLSAKDILLLKKRWIYVKGKSPDPTWRD